MRRSVSALLLASTLLCGCSVFEQPEHLRGNRVDADQLKELVPGTSTRADVTSLLGSPTAKASFDDNTWIYISEVTQPRIGRIQGINHQDVTVISFNNAGVMQGYKKLNKQDSVPVSVVGNATPSPGSESSFLQQLLGNVGRFGAGPTPGGGGGSGNGLSVGR